MSSADRSLIQYVTETSNNLSNSILVGTLFFYDLPTDITDLYGLPVGDSQGMSDHDGRKWKWLDIEILAYILELVDRELSSFAQDLRFLIRNRFAMASYQVVHLPSFPYLANSGNSSICAVRVYSIPSDIEGARHLQKFRYNQPRSLFVDKAARHTWWRLLCHFDFTKESWEMLQTWVESELFRSVALLPVQIKKSIGRKADKATPDQNVVNFHIQRWINKEGFKRLPASIAKRKTEKTLAQKLLKIYNSIPSPEFEKYANLNTSRSNQKGNGVITEPVEVIMSLLSHKGAPLKGMKTTLYPFQLNSLTKMFEKEAIPEKKLVPYYLELKDLGDKPFYFDMNQGLFCTSPELYQLPRGGILAENMGLGKTIITLGLICLTKNDMSSIPEDRILYSDNDKKGKALDYRETNALSNESSVKKLTELCKKMINQNSLPWKYFIQDLPESVIKILVNSPGSFKMPIDPDTLQENSRRKSSLRSRNSSEGERVNYKTLYLCNTTLIFVPENLFHQWNNELKKHIEDGFLKKLFISNQIRNTTSGPNSMYTNEIPSDIKELIDYDLIIISHSFITKQQREGTPSIDILRNIYWKRLIIDEGHSTSSKTSKTSLLCRDIESERRWAVTGTPTSGLTRLSMDEDDTDDKTNSTLKKTKYTVKTSINEKDDLAKLGTIVGSFLNVEPYYTNPKLWSTLVSKPLSENKHGATLGLSNLLNSVVVRHSLTEVDKDLRLPKLHHIPVFLKPSYHNILAINLFTAVLAVNAVSSERTDIDYMFHPSNRQQLRRLITNLQRATFHWTGFKQEDVEILITICQNSLKKHYERNGKVYTDEDVLLLKQSMAVAKQALSNSRWRTIALLHEMNYYVSGLPEAFIKNFGTGIMENNGTDNNARMVGVFGAPHLNAIQEFFYKNRFMNMENEELLATKLSEASKPFWKSYWGETTKRNMERFNKQDANQEFKVSNDQVENAIQVPDIVLDSPSKKKRKLSDTLNGGADLELERQDFINQYQVHNSIEEDASFETTRNAEILGTGSAKLSYISSRLLEHQQKDVKSIVFFEFEDSAYYLTELLDVLGVNYILYATFVNPSQRATNLTDFSSYDKGGITLIMDLRLASHGLNIIAATRVYFLSPVWQRSVEAQAIKRAHRIGQMNEVFVETLVLEGTLEEEIYRKRSDDKQEEKDEGRDESATPVPSQSSATKKYVIDDMGMQEFILRHKFLAQLQGDSEYNPFQSTAVSQTPCKSQDDVPNESSLLDHSERVVDGTRQWDMKLFTNSNLVKLISVKNQRIRKEFLEQDYVRRFIDPNEQLDTERMSPEVVQKTPARKKVRF